jgi:hypothetical protein
MKPEIAQDPAVDTSTWTVKRIAHVFGCAKKDSEFEVAMYRALVERMAKKLSQRAPTATNKALARLESAALAIGDCHLAGIDPGWSESNEVEQASILYTKAVRAEQEGK